MISQECDTETPDESASRGACETKQEEIKEEKTSVKPKKISPEVILVFAIAAVFAVAFAAIVLFQ